MLIHICDKCHERMDRVRLEFAGLIISIDGKEEHIISPKEFCSLYCQQQYIINGMKGKGLDDHIKV